MANAVLEGAARRAPRWELYRLLGEPTRLRMLGLCAAEELAIGELAELLGELQPKVSRHASALRDAGVVQARRHGTWVLLRLSQAAQADAVISDAVRAGTELCAADGALERLAAVVAARDAPTRDFFARAGRAASPSPPQELGAYLCAVAALLPERRLAIDAGTGDGALLEVLAPVFERVIALDRSKARIEQARERAAQRGLDNVRFVCGELDGPEIGGAIKKLAGVGKLGAAQVSGADAVFAARMLHHQPAPARALKSLAALCRPPARASRGGALLVIDYELHKDWDLREEAADLWLGFDGEELEQLARDAGLGEIHRTRIPAAWCGQGPDQKLKWQLLSARRS